MTHLPDILNNRIIYIPMLVILAIALAVWAGVPKAPESGNPRNQTELISYIDALAESGVSPAVSVAVIQNGKLIWEYTAGTANPFSDHAATTDTVYHWWSLTKIATALTILDLAENGMLDIDQPVSAFLPDFKITGLEVGAGPITLRHLLTHTSGLPDPIPAMFGWVRYDADLPNQSMFLQKVMADTNKLKFQPGTDRAYSNLGYMVLGAVIESVTDKRYEEVVTERVLVPAGMWDSAFVFRPDMDANEALGTHPIAHYFTPILPFYLDIKRMVKGRIGNLLWFDRFYINATPPTGLIGTARDAARLGYVAMVSGDILDDAALNLLMPANGQIPLGWHEWERAPNRWYQHRGGGPGFAAILRIYPERGLVIAVTGNGTTLPVEDVVDAVFHVEILG